MPGQPPPIPVMPAGYGPSDANFNGWIRDPLTFLAARPSFVARQTGAQSIPSATTTTLQLQAIDEDLYGGWVTTGSTPNYRWVCPASGWYQVTLNVWLNQGTGTQLLDPILNINGTTSELCTPWLVVSDTAGGAVGGQIAYLVAGQYLQAQLFHSNATALNTSVTFGQQSSLAAHWISS